MCASSFPGNEAQFSTSPAGTPKKTKVEAYKLAAQQKALIKEDEANAKLWNEALEALKDGPVWLWVCARYEGPLPQRTGSDRTAFSLPIGSSVPLGLEEPARKMAFPCVSPLSTSVPFRCLAFYLQSSPFCCH